MKTKKLLNEAKRFGCELPRLYETLCKDIHGRGCILVGTFHTS